jgi:pilus assembly protein Flp/PilA
MEFLKKTFKNARGAAVTEYALLVALIAIVVIAAITLLGTQIRTIFENITTALGG